MGQHSTAQRLPPSGSAWVTPTTTTSSTATSSASTRNNKQPSHFSITPFYNPAGTRNCQHTVTKHSTHSGKESVESCCGDDDVNDKDYLDMTSARCWEAKFPNIDLEIKIEKFCLLSSQRTCPAGLGRDV